MNSKAKLLNWIIGLIIIIAALFMGYVMIKSTEPAQTTDAETFVLQNLEVRGLNVCESIGSDYDCSFQPDATYRKGDTIYIYGEAKNLVASNNKVGFTQTLEVINPEGQVIINEQVLDVDRSVGDEGVYQLPFKNNFDTLQDDILGDYIASITLTDKNTGQKSSDYIYFRLA